MKKFYNPGSRLVRGLKIRRACGVLILSTKIRMEMKRQQAIKIA